MIKSIPRQDSQDVPLLFDENVYGGGCDSTKQYFTLADDDEEQDDEEEEKAPPRAIDNYLNQEATGALNDILEEPEDYFDRSSSLNSNNMRRMLSGSNEEFKVTSDLTKFSKEESGTLSNGAKYSKPLKTGKLYKKGMFFYNERVVTLSSTPRLFYVSHGVEKEIDLNPTTCIKQVMFNQFEIINYYPTTKYRFKTTTESECEEWIIYIKKAIQTIISE